METGLCECGCGQKTNKYSQSCTKIGYKKGQHCRFVKGHHARALVKKGKDNHSWKGGRYISYAGYVMVSTSGHPREQQNGYTREHILIAEKALGRPLPDGVQVHHYGDVSDNSKLIICEDQKYHHLLHIRARALIECGDANKRKCKFCKEYDHVENLYCKQGKKHRWNVYHVDCGNAYRRERRRIRKDLEK